MRLDLRFFGVQSPRRESGSADGFPSIGLYDPHKAQLPALRNVGWALIFEAHNSRVTEAVNSYSRPEVRQDSAFFPGNSFLVSVSQHGVSEWQGKADNSTDFDAGLSFLKLKTPTFFHLHNLYVVHSLPSR